MRLKSSIAVILMATALLTPARRTAAEEHAWTISPLGGYGQFSNKLKWPVDSLADAPLAGFRLGRSFGEYWVLEAGGSYASTHGLKADGTDGLDATVITVSGSLIGELSPLNRFGSLYVAGGGGWHRYNSPKVTDDLHFGTVEMAVGWRKPLNDLLSIRLEARNILSIPKKDYPSANKADQQYWGGITLGFGGAQKDSDGDGVADKKDKCPDTPKGATVNAVGCPNDSDGDGVFDGLDQCVGTPKGATVDARGCPVDSDGDGVYDGLDQCPDTPKNATVDARGCPSDADGDGVLDGLDQCPGTPKGATVDAKGCPTDSDGDGVLDGLDQCANTAAGLKVDSNGCPIEVTEKETELLDTGMIRLQNVNFETGKSTLLPESFAALDEVGGILLKWPQLKIEVGGHTDSRGTVAKNQVLSEARAQAVKEYLAAKFSALDAGQLTVKGYGLTKPLVRNTTPLNMAKNRRVEFKVLNRDALKKEIERRKMLRK